MTFAVRAKGKGATAERKVRAEARLRHPDRSAVNADRAAAGVVGRARAVVIKGAMIEFKRGVLVDDDRTTGLRIAPLVGSLVPWER